MKILITTDWYYPVVNGVVMSVLTLAKELRKRGHDVKILTLSGTCHSYRDGDTVYMASVGAGCVYPQARVKLPSPSGCVKELLEWRPDLIHSQCEFSTFPAARRLARELDVPIVHTCHTVYEEYTHYFSPSREWGKRFVRRAMLSFSGQVSAIIAPSEKTKRLLEEYGVSCPVYVVPTGIDVKRYAGYQQPVWRDKIREKFHVKPETTVLLYVGRLAKEKNIEDLLRFQQKAAGRNTMLLIVGDGPCRFELEKKVKLLGIEQSVIFTGMIPHEQIGEYYQAGDFFVSASVSETQGITYGEALASGLPLLCRRDDCLKDIVAEGENGWQYESPEEFLKFLGRWMNLGEFRKEEMRREARQSAKLFSEEHFARKVETIYEAERQRQLDQIHNSETKQKQSANTAGIFFIPTSKRKHK